MEIIDIIEQMAPYGTAPSEGCSLFGIGYEDALARINKMYLYGSFERGKSTEKFVVGPFGSGKTHFLRQLSDLGKKAGCFTAEVNLNKELDVTKNLIVYKEIMQEIKPPGKNESGVRALVEACVDNVRGKSPDEDMADELLARWISGLDQANLKPDVFGRVAKKCFEAYIEKNEVSLNDACDWLGGDISNRDLAKRLSISAVSKDEHDVYAKRMLHSVFRLVRLSGFRGTIVCLDESEQGFQVDRKKLNRILSMLQSGINAINDLNGGSALVVYALTPDIENEMEKFMALKQRVSDPGRGLGFFNGNVLAPKIDLSMRQAPADELFLIGSRLADLMYEQYGEKLVVDKQSVIDEIKRIADGIETRNPSSGKRRDMVKRTCTMLVNLYYEGKLISASDTDDNPIDDLDEV